MGRGCVCFISVGTAYFPEYHYIVQGPGDFASDTSTFPSNSTVLKQLRDELISLFPDDGESWAARLSGVFDIHCRSFKNM